MLEGELMRPIAQAGSARGEAPFGNAIRVGAAERSARFVVLDSWRGICALLVATYHFPFVGQGFALPFVRHSYLFVDFFFVLSGFVLCHAYSRKISGVADAGRFLIRRIGRIWPLHVALLSAFVILECIRQVAQSDGFGPSRSLTSLFDNILLMQAWGFEQTLTWNGPSWSISVEFALYILFAAILWLLPRRLVLVSAGAAIAGVVIVGLMSPTYVGATVQYGLPRGAAGFFIGVLVCRLAEVWRPRVTTVIEGLTALAIVVFVSYAGYAGWRPLFASLIFGVAVFVFSSEGGAFSSILSRPFALVLGTWSYSIYMVHMLVISAFKVVATRSGSFTAQLDGSTTLFSTPQPWASDLLLLLYLAVVVSLSAMTFRFIEAPSRAFFNGIASRSQPALYAVTG
jgi:peptidoglycan/LPS O-acetylase OafA/YrhL